MRHTLPVLFAFLLGPTLAHAEDLQQLLKTCKAASCTKLGQRLIKGEFIKLTSEGTVTPKTRALLKNLFKRACLEGHGEGCWEWGAAASAPEEETRAFELGCNAGYEEACMEFGLRLSNGEGIAQDDARAAKLLEPICKNNNTVRLAAACSQLGVLALQGRGVKQDTARALRLMDEACRAEDEIACQNADNVRRRLGAR